MEIEAGRDQEATFLSSPLFVWNAFFAWLKYDKLDYRQMKTTIFI